MRFAHRTKTATTADLTSARAVVDANLFGTWNTIDAGLPVCRSAGLPVCRRCALRNRHALSTSAPVGAPTECVRGAVGVDDDQGGLAGDGEVCVDVAALSLIWGKVRPKRPKSSTGSVRRRADLDAG